MGMPIKCTSVQKSKENIWPSISEIVDQHKIQEKFKKVFVRTFFIQTKTSIFDGESEKKI